MDLYHIGLGIGKESKISQMPQVITNLLSTRNQLQFCIDCNGRISEYYGPELSIKGNKEDVISWLVLFKEEYPEIENEIEAILLEIHRPNNIIHPGLGISIRLDQII